LSGTTETKEGPRFVLFAESRSYYSEEAFQAAFNEAFLGLLASAIPEGGTARKVARSIVGMKNKARYEAVLKTALSRLSRTESVSAAEVDLVGGTVVAAFPV